MSPLGWLKPFMRLSKSKSIALLKIRIRSLSVLGTYERTEYQIVVDPQALADTQPLLCLACASFLY